MNHFTSNYNSLTWNEISLCRKKRFWQPLFPIKQNPGNEIRIQYQKVCDVLKHNKRMLMHFPHDLECTYCHKDIDLHDIILGKAATIQSMSCCALLALVSCNLRRQQNVILPVRPVPFLSNVWIVLIKNMGFLTLS